MKKKDQESFLRKLSVLLFASISLEEAISLSSRYSKRKDVKREAERINKGVIEGLSLSVMLSRSSVWGKTTIALTRIGELSGSLGTYLKEASQIIKEEREEKTKMIGALLYPLIVGALAFLMVIFLVSFVFPKITPLFEGMKGNLPWSTRLVMLINSVVISYGLIIAAIFILSIAICIYFVRTSIAARLRFERVLLSMPIIGQLFRWSILRHSSFLLGALLQSGITLQECLALVIESQSFISIKVLFNDLMLKARAGTSFSDCLLGEEFFSSWTDLVLIGERSGKLSEMFLQLSSGHKSEIEEMVASATKLIEPILMIVVGGVVGLIALSIITPMYSLTQNVR